MVDERGEIAAIYKGIPQNDIGIRTDVNRQCAKARSNENTSTLYGTTNYSM